MIQTQRQICFLTAVHLATSGVLGLLNWNASLGDRDDDGARGDQNKSASKQEHANQTHFAFSVTTLARIKILNNPTYGRWHARQNSCR